MYGYGKRGLYKGTSEMRDDFRIGRHFEDILIENDQYEGDVVAKVRRLFKKREMFELEQYIKQLESEGWSRERLNSIVTRAMFGRI